MAAEPTARPAAAASAPEDGAATPRNPSLPPLTLAAARQRLLRTLYTALAVAAALGGLAWAGVGLGPALPLDTRLPVMLGCVALALLAVGATTLPPGPSAAALPLVLLASLAVLGGGAAYSGIGLAAPELALLALLVCLAWAVGRPRDGLLATVASALLLLGLALAEWLHPGAEAAAGALGAAAGLGRAAGVSGGAAGGVVGGAPGVAGALSPWPAGVTLMRLLMLGTSVGVGAVCGRALAQLLQRQLQAADVRERRFQSLLGIAVTAYWETDAALRLRRASFRDAHGQFQPLHRTAGRLPWALGPLKLEPEVADALRADMEGREPLRDVPLQWDCSDGSSRHLLASGQPRHDAGGRFLGYWGVARDVTGEVLTRDQLHATERRYEELFLHLPTPMVVHRRGRILDANPAAARLLGYPSAARMLGHDLLAEHLDEAERRQAHARVAQLERLPIGQPLPAVPYRMVASDGRVLQVRALDARADGDPVPAMMSILTDETAALEAARARQRAEALFAQVLATSPDVITLCDLASGEFLMVNEAFSRLTGWAADEAAGRSAQELGIWRDGAEYQRLQALLAQRGAVGNVTLHYWNRQGQATPMLVAATRFEREGRLLLVINARDYADAERLRLQREAILAQASVGIAFVREGRFEMANPHFERIYGWERGTLTGQPAEQVWAGPEELQAVHQHLEPALRRGEAAEVERPGRRRDGSSLRVRLRVKALDALHPQEMGTIWIAEDVTRQRADEAALAAARDQAQAASRAKSSFLANASHAIRTPLHALLGLARLARQPGLTMQRQRAFMDQVADSAEQLSTIVGDILDLSKIEAGTLELQPEPFDMRKLLHGLQQAYAALAAGHGLAFSVEIDRALPLRVQGDAQRLRQILGNYLHHALQHTHSGSLRLVVLRRPDERVRFEVHDTGAGLDEAALARVFEPFGPPEDGGGRRVGSLGLSMCRELAQLMGGSVGASSAPGRGTCLHLELPLPAAIGLPDEPTDDLADLNRLRSARVLLVEDNAVNMMIASAMLAQWGVQVIEAADGTQALLRLAEAQQAGRPVQVVLMDVQMPGPSGLEVTQRIRRSQDERELPVIAVTAGVLPDERERALAAGMNDVVTKPIDAERLRRVLIKALKQQAGATSPAG